MRVETIRTSRGNTYQAHLINKNKTVNSHNNVPLGLIQFTGNGLNLKQLASLTPENNGLGLPEAALGGEGCVGFEAPQSMIQHEGMDVRSFMPFWEYNNPKGGYKFMIHHGKLPADGLMPAEAFYSADYGETLEMVAKKLNIPQDHLSYVIQSKPINGKSKYCLLEPTSIKGEIARPSDAVLGEIERIPYALFKISSKNPSYNKIKDTPNYFVYTRALAKTAKPYSYDSWGNVTFDAEIINSDEMRAIMDFLNKKMNTEEFGYYNPAGVWCHDRPTQTFVVHLANQSARGDKAVAGLKAHATIHNTGRNYQGFTFDPFKFLTVVADEQDIKELKESPYFYYLEKAKRYGIDSEQLSPREKQIVHAIIDPYLKNFRDGSGAYNILETSIAGAVRNPENITAGTVSYEFGKEMRSPLTYDAAKFLTDDYAKVPQHDVLNGSTPANLRLNDPTADFGRGANGLSKHKEGFQTFTYNGENIEEVISTREHNRNWFSSLVEEYYKKGHEELRKLFFNDTQIQEGHDVLGHLRAMKDGDIHYMGWGRPDEQKGYVITWEGFLKFLKRTDVPTEVKKRCFLTTGAGPWPVNDRDFVRLNQILKEIQELEGGIYADQAMHVSGYYPNRLVACAQYGVFTSRREMCGITPYECKAAGVPYAATKTGGPVDYTNASNGYLTREAVELNPDRFGLTWQNTAEEIDNARVANQSDQMSDLFKQMTEDYIHDREGYVQKCKKNIEEKIDWHNNSEYNRGKSANRRYLEDIFETHKPIESRNHNPLRRLAESFGEHVETVESQIKLSSKNPLRYVAVAFGAAALTVGGYYLYKNLSNKPKDKELNKVA